jgi:hypothetical protein
MHSYLLPIPLFLVKLVELLEDAMEIIFAIYQDAAFFAHQFRCRTIIISEDRYAKQQCFRGIHSETLLR